MPLMTIFVELKFVLFGDFIFRLSQVEFYEHRNCSLNFYRLVDADLYKRFIRKTNLEMIFQWKSNIVLVEQDFNYNSR